MKKQTELLAPAGSYESIRAAMAAGADAVYVGGVKFGARAYAGNLDQEDMCRAIDFVHLHGGKLYMTVNTLLKDAEAETLSGYLRPYYRQGLDGVIVQDLGVFSCIRREFPGLPLHVSTQMTLLGAPGAALLKEMGAVRIVPARELSLEEIRQIKREVDIEVEAFVHGALCYCYSGQCLFSSLLGGRSGNRGRCAQPCRLPYRVKAGVKQRPLSDKGESYLLSPKDMCTIELLPELLEAGIDSFKIEGRMKRPEYTAGVVSVYRKYIDLYRERGRKGFRVEPEDMEILLSLYNRGGFSKGYYGQKNGRSMISLSRPSHFGEKGKSNFLEMQQYEALLSGLREKYLTEEKKEKIHGSLRLSKETNNVFRVEYKGIEAVVTGPPCQEPVNHPMTENTVCRQMEKTGNTPFEWESLEIQMDEPVFVPVQSLNELRRRGLNALEEKICGQYRRDLQGIPLQSSLKGETAEKCCGEREKNPSSDKGKNTCTLRVQLEMPWMLPLVLGEPGVDAVYINGETFFHIWKPGGNGQNRGRTLADARISGGLADQTPLKTAELCRKAGKECYLALPPVFRLREREAFEAWYPEFLKAGFAGVLLRNLEELQFLREKGYKGALIPDACLYTFNREARKVWMDFGAAFTTLPYELNERELLRRGCREDELVVYGYQPLMITANCLAKTLGRCQKKPGFLYLEDRYQKHFPVRCCCEGCYNVIYNSAPLYLLDSTKEISGLNPGGLRLHFTLEGEKEITRILSEAVSVYKNGNPPDLFPKEFTRGHLKRGVE